MRRQVLCVKCIWCMTQSNHVHARRVEVASANLSFFEFNHHLSEAWKSPLRCRLREVIEKDECRIFGLAEQTSQLRGNVGPPSLCGVTDTKENSNAALGREDEKHEFPLRPHDRIENGGYNCGKKR